MNKAKLKTYAPQARKDFIAAVMARANLLGISEKHGKLEIAPSEKKGDVTLIAGLAWPAKVHEQRERLIKRIQKVGLGGMAEAIAYTWFNRFAALRFLEIHDYLGHGHRVLSSREGGLPEIIAHATELVGKLPGLSAQQVADMKLAGNKDGELYRLLLVSQCNALSSAMPFLFERIDDESELLLPGNLERTDSVVAKMVDAIPEEDWNEVEVIGWLYQFYISEKKDEVIGQVVKSEDIPAATQLFTPNWIVQYLVQNSVGRLWLMANPSSTLKSHWLFYIEPAEQAPEAQAQLDALIKTRMDEDSGTLNPETITVLDPACGSGHILVEAYEVLKVIYLERGYQARAIPRLILEKNLYGLDIDDRAAQMSGFALLMKARADDRRLLESPVKLNVVSMQESTGMDLEEFSGHLNSHGINRAVLGKLLETFSHSKTFGSLIQIPKVLEDGMAALEDGIARAIESGDVFAKSAAQDLMTLVQQAKILGMRFDAVVANPPYMGNGYFNDRLSKFAVDEFDRWSGDLFTCFIKKSLTQLKPSGIASLITISTWTFLPTYSAMRAELLSAHSILSIIDNGRGVWGSDHGSLMLSMLRTGLTCNAISTKNLTRGKGKVQQVDQIKDKYLSLVAMTRLQDIFLETPDNVISVGVSDLFIKLLSNERKLSDLAEVRQGLKTGEINKFMRFWHEVSLSDIYFDCSSSLASKNSTLKWYPCNKGGEFRKWYGNNDFLLDWKGDGEAIKNFKDSKGKLRSRPQNLQFFFREGVTWSTVTMGRPSFRYSGKGRTFESGGSTIFFENGSDLYFSLGVINSFLGEQAVTILSPKVSLGEGAVARFPVPQFPSREVEIASNAESLVDLFREIDRETESCPDFNLLPQWKAESASLPKYFEACLDLFKSRLETVSNMEYRNDEIIAAGIGLAIPPKVEVDWDDYGVIPMSAASLAKNLASYAIGCMMGRYSLDEPGLIYAHAGNVGFDTTRYKTFPADADGIVPITDELWFEDDAANRIREFFIAVWSTSALEENIAWLAESLGIKGNETPDETIRRYLASSFFKDHQQTYKRRPIYWHFSSGKQGAFQALVYLHRYHEGTLARMRAEYVVPLTGKMQTRIEMLEKDRDAASSTAARNKIAKQIESLKKKHIELLAYDEKLRHYADMRINIDLDDGVKENYGKFGDLLAEVKAVTGGTGDE
jgi:hypothetical protein